MTSREIRQQFIDFFGSKGHAYVPSSAVVPFDDPTLMFTNAGMNQFKPIFLGTESPKHLRVANTQKCIRAGGKHNDLDDVGQDTYHHTFFEMLGNWSFGDYFKKEAIEWAWELLTKVWGIDKTRLHATYFGGLHSEPRASARANAPEARAQEIEGTREQGIERSRDRGVDPSRERERADDSNRQSTIGNRQWELEPDQEARDMWLSVTDIDPSHVHPGGMKDNFWEMGDTGPCGPCSEIHIDLTPDKSGAALVNRGDARVIEIWNLVFIQFNRATDGKLTPLPAKHVDTGMGFERLSAVLQHKKSNYDTDVFAPIFAAIQKRTKAPAYTGLLPGMGRDNDPSRDRKGADDQYRDRQGAGSAPPLTKGGPGGVGSTIDNAQLMVDVSYRVIADHVRCLTFALTDGAIPSNEGRGYVLRRILRRAVRYGRQYMNMHEPFLCDLVPAVGEHMADAFPELRSAHRSKNVEHVSDLIREEETSFLKTLDRGIKLFNDAADYARRQHHGRIRSEDAFKLHDTYGFPIDLTERMAQEEGLTVDIGEYERLMEDARQRARGSETELGQEEDDLTRQTIAQARETEPSDDSMKYDESLRCIARIVAKGWNVALDDPSATEGQTVVLSLDRTPFYAEQGGQVSDRGWIRPRSGGEIEVARVVRHGNTITHHGIVTRGRIVAGLLDECEAVVSRDHRIPTMQNHTATHILNWALREVLGEHVQQKGSLVDPEKTRFDFSHPKQLSEDELRTIEGHVKSQISNSLDVLTATEVEQKKAREINTLRAVFGEKYPDKVRVVSIGADIEAMLRDPKNAKWMQYSVEFCGGTHLKNSKEAEDFVLVHEEAVAKGVRRLVGVTAGAAREAIRRGEEFLEIADALCRPEPRASARADSRVSEAPPESDRPRGLKPAAQVDLPRLLRELSEATIPILARHRLADTIAQLQEAAKEQQKKSAAQSQRGAVEAVGDLLASKAMDVGGVTVVVGDVPGANADALRSGIDFVRNKKGSSAVLLASIDDGKVTLVAGVSKDLVDRGLKAGDLVKEICPLVGGKGGGRPDMAQGGGTDPKGLPKALDRAKEWISQKLGC